MRGRTSLLLCLPWWFTGCRDEKPPDGEESGPGETESVDTNEEDTTVESSADDTGGRDLSTLTPGRTAPPTPPPEGGFVIPDLAGKNIVYLHIDTFRADHLGAYGYGRNTLPRVGGLPWLVVQGIHAGSSWTMPSTASLLTAAPPDVHGFTDDGGDPGSKGLELNIPTVAATFHDAGWASALYSGNRWLTDFTNMASEFDTFQSVPKEPDAYNLLAILAVAFPWLDSVPKGTPFFLFLQPMDLHLPVQIQKSEQGAWGDPDRPWDLVETSEWGQIHQMQSALEKDPAGATQALIDTYDEEMLGLDIGLAVLMTGLEDRGLLDNTVVILTGDHGETLNDTLAAEVGHGQSLRNELIRNPFLLLAPGGEGGHIDCLMPNQDVFPSLLDSWGLPPMASALGVSRRAACPGIAVTSLWALPTVLDRIVVTTETEKLELLCDGTGERGFDLVLDPAELSPVEPDTLVSIDRLRGELEAAMTRIGEQIPDFTCDRG